MSTFKPIYKSVIELDVLEQFDLAQFWKMLSLNSTAIHILEKNMNKVDWLKLSGNPNAIHMLEKNLDKVTRGVLGYFP